MVGGVARSRWLKPALGIAALAAAVLLGLELRLADPASSPMVPAEDPYTHLALVREHLRDGQLDPLYEATHLYPPGLHALLASLHAYSGIPAYDLVRWAPAFLGAIGVAGIGLLLWRIEGAAAAAIGATAAAVAPELVFRTGMMAPTALDLALVPFLLHGALQLARGRLGWWLPTAATALFLVFAHPWVFAILAPAGLLFAALAVALPWPTRVAGMSLRGLMLAAGIVGIGAGLALTGCDGWCGPGVGQVLHDEGKLAAYGPWAILASSVPILLAIAWPRRWRATLTGADATPRLRAGLLLGGLAAGAAWATAAALAAGMPEQVDLARMLGWPILALGAAGAACAILGRSPVGYAGLALAAATYPFVVLDPFDSPFWPHRTAAYLGLGLAVLCGVAAAAVVRAATRVRVPAASSWPVPTTAAVTVLVAGSLGGVVGAAGPEPYDGWYRLFGDCDFALLQEVAARADLEPEALVVASDWQSKMVLAGLAGNASRVWLKPTFFSVPADRSGILAKARDEGIPLYAVAVVPADTGPLSQHPWQPIPSPCPHPPKVTAYRLA